MTIIKEKKGQNQEEFRGRSPKYHPLIIHDAGITHKRKRLFFHHGKKDASHTNNENEFMLYFFRLNIRCV